jgi:hypothetical protein
MKLVTVVFGICVLLATSHGAAVAGSQKSGSHARVQGCNVGRKKLVAPSPSSPSAHSSSNQPAVSKKHGQASRANTAKTALASKFNAVSAVDKHNANDDPTWAPIDVSDLDRVSE